MQKSLHIINNCQLAVFIACFPKYLCALQETVYLLDYFLGFLYCQCWTDR